MELHGSRLAVESELGRGTTFLFDLRLKRAAAGEACDESLAAGPPVLKGLKILVADDNEVNVLVLTGLLRRWGVEPDVVTNGREAGQPRHPFREAGPVRVPGGLAGGDGKHVIVAGVATKYLRLVYT